MSEELRNRAIAKYSNDSRQPKCSALRFVAVLLCLAMTIPALPGLLPRNASADSQTFWVDDFSGDWQWTATDSNSADGVDTWGKDPWYGQGGSSDPCAWCAEVGVQGTAGQANTEVEMYDDYMDSMMEINLPSISGYSEVLLVFYFKLDLTGDYTGGIEFPQDEFQLWVYDGAWAKVWSLGDGALVSTWTYANYILPATATKIGFGFHSDYRDHASDGAWVDSVRLDGTDITVPGSSVNYLPASSSDPIVQIPFTASDTGSGVKYVELYYMRGGSGTYSRYTYGSPGGTGHWTSSPITFDSNLVGGPGTYYFYTIATDNHDNVEDPPAGGYDRKMDINTLAVPELGPLTLVVAIVPALVVIARRAARRGKEDRP